MLLLTNDDGIDAPGLGALEVAAEGLSLSNVVVAPLTAYSGCGHTVTTHKPIAIHNRGRARFAIDGTPADCVRVAIHHLATETSWVLSGINAGGNLGGDVHLSGTVAAAREAASHGIPAVAVSQYIARNRLVDWHRAAGWTRSVLSRLLEMGCEPGAFWNVNLPHIEPSAADPDVVFCPLDPSPMPIAYRISDGGSSVHYEGNYHARARKAGTDIDVCFGGAIAISLLKFGTGW
jgi:5'-nucleotidase